MKQFIFGRYDPRLVDDSKKKLIRSSVYRSTDFISQGYTPRQGGSGVLYTWENTPIAFWDVPTLNNMVFSRALWEMLLENSYLRASLEGRCHWGEAFHANSDEMHFPDIAIRVTDFHLDRDNLVLGDVDLMDTPNGLTIYSCVKTGRAGISSRGFGELKDLDNGLRDVVSADYQHIGFDCVTFPAVPAAHMSLVEQSAMATKELGAMSDHLRGLIEKAYESNPGSRILRDLYSAVGGSTRKYFNVQNALASALVSHRLHSGVTPLRSGGRRGIMSRRRVVSSPDNESFRLFVVGLDAKLKIFCESLQARLEIELGMGFSVSLERKFLRLNQNVFYTVDISVGGKPWRAIRLVGSKTSLDYQVSIFGVRVEGFVRLGFFNNALVLKVVSDLKKLLGVSGGKGSV